MTAAQVDPYLTDHALLRVGEREREVFLVKRVEVIAHGAEHIAPVEALAPFLGPQQLELEEEVLLVLQPSGGLLDLNVV